MRAVQLVSDRLLELFAPKAEASALWIWQYLCVTDPICTYQGHNYNTYLYCYCHDGSGYCTNCSFVSCC